MAYKIKAHRGFLLLHKSRVQPEFLDMERGKIRRLG